MGIFKSEEEKAEEARREAERQAMMADLAAKKEQRRADEAYAAGPVGQAKAAKAAGLRFFEVQLDVSRTEGSASFGAATGSETRSTGHPDTLGEIEAIGWTLEHVGYVYQVTGEETTDKFVTTGQRVAVTGKTVGIYLFRSTS